MKNPVFYSSGRVAAAVSHSQRAIACHVGLKWMWKCSARHLLRFGHHALGRGPPKRRTRLFLGDADLHLAANWPAIPCSPRREYAQIKAFNIEGDSCRGPIFSGVIGLPMGIPSYGPRPMPEKRCPPKIFLGDLCLLFVNFNVSFHAFGSPFLMFTK